jgi:hypothetical protein
MIDHYILNNSQTSLVKCEKDEEYNTICSRKDVHTTFRIKKIRESVRFRTHRISLSQLLKARDIYLRKMKTIQKSSNFLDFTQIRSYKYLFLKLETYEF